MLLEWEFEGGVVSSKSETNKKKRPHQDKDDEGDGDGEGGWREEPDDELSKPKGTCIWSVRHTQISSLLIAKLYLVIMYSLLLATVAAAVAVKVRRETQDRDERMRRGK